VLAKTLSQDFADETRTLVRSRMPYVTTVVLALVAVSWLVQHQIDPSRDGTAAWVGLLEMSFFVGVWVLCRHRALRDRAVLISSAGCAVLPILTAAYHVMVGIEAERLAMALVCMVAAGTVVMPWGLRGQLPMAFAAFASYAVGLAVGLPGPEPLWVGLAGVGLVSALSLVGAHTLETYRYHLFRANGELQAAYEAVKAAGLAKNEFIANLSHELRTPLNTIVGYTDLLLDDDFGEITAEMRTPIERMSRSADNLRALINDLIDLALIEAGRMRVEMKEVPLAPLFDELAALTGPMLCDKPIQLRCSEPDSLAVKADTMRLRQILTNLVGNAAKYTPQGEIEVRAEKRNGRVLIGVRDTGIGVPAEEIQAIFKPFFRGTRHGDAAGVGLGLSMSARLAELMGGEITVESDLGKGSTFTLHLDAS
jgi:signal transduction histidine kinase